MPHKTQNEGESMNTMVRLTSLRNACSADGDRAGEIACIGAAAQYATAVQIFIQNLNFARCEDKEFEEAEATSKKEGYRTGRARGERGAKKCTRRPRPNDKQPTKERT